MTILVSRTMFLRSRYPIVPFISPYDLWKITFLAVHLMANAVHKSEAPDVHDCLCSTLD